MDSYHEHEIDHPNNRERPIRISESELIKALKALSILEQPDTNGSHDQAIKTLKRYLLTTNATFLKP